MEPFNLSGSQRRFLKQLAHPLKPLVRLGKEGPSQRFLARLREQIEAHELIKARVLNNCMATREEIDGAIEGQGVAVVQRVGHLLTIYKPNQKKPTIRLPRP